MRRNAPASGQLAWSRKWPESVVPSTRMGGRIPAFSHVREVPQALCAVERRR